VAGLARASVLAFGTYVTGAVLTYIAQLLIARLVGAESYGVYAYVFAWMTIFAYVAALGFDVSLLRLIPTYRATRQWGLLRGVIQYADRRCMAAGLTFLLGGSALVWLMAGRMTPELARCFYFGFALVPVWSLLWITSSTVRALGGVISALAPDRIVRDGALIVFLIYLRSWARVDLDSSGVMLLTLATSLVGLAVVRFNARRWQPLSVVAALPQHAAGEWRRAALPLVSISVAETLLNRTGVVLLGWMGQTTSAGIYALVFNLAIMVMLPRMAVNALFAPLVSDLMARNNRPALQFATTRTAVWSFVSALCIAIPIMLLAGPLLSWFGPDFSQGAPAIRILLAGQILSAAFGSQMFLMTMAGHEYMAAGMLIGATSVNAIAGLALIRLVGLTGAAISTSVALVIWNISMSAFIWRRLGIVPGVWALFLMRGVHVRARSNLS
jgi:O-antigen/teichoic acid export membrane protein